MPGLARYRQVTGLGSWLTAVVEGVACPDHYQALWDSPAREVERAWLGAQPQGDREQPGSELCAGPAPRSSPSSLGLRLLTSSPWTSLPASTCQDFVTNVLLLIAWYTVDSNTWKVLETL